MIRNWIVLLLVAVALVAAGATAVWWSLGRGDGARPGGAEAPRTMARYHCPMHPTMISDQPGDCPICKMRLVPIDASLMGSDDEHAGHEETPAGVLPDDRAAVRLTSQKRQLIGVKTSMVENATFTRTIRAVGSVMADETRLHHIHTKVAGFVERLHANATGELVRKGRPLLEIYSPELLSSQQEFLVALQARDRVASSSLEGVAASGSELVESARRRLELFDISAAQIDELERTRVPSRTLTLYAPATGYIMERFVTVGERVGPESNLLNLADLSRVWVIASIYEYELPYITPGQKATMTLTYLPGKSCEGRVTLIYPMLDAATRTVRLRLEFANPDLTLKPEMYTDVLLSGDLGERLAVPSSAVIETGTRSIVFVDRGEGLFEPREVEIGLRLPNLYEARSGLAAGESVLTSGTFLVDSESKLKAALSAMGESTPPPGHQH